MDASHAMQCEEAAWQPSTQIIQNANITKLMQKLAFNSVSDFHAWTCHNTEEYLKLLTEELGIVFKKMPHSNYQANPDEEFPIWFPGAKINIADSCFTAPGSKIAIITQDDCGKIKQYAYHDLNCLSNRVANSLVKLGFQPSDPIAIAMPMDYYAVAIYLGIIKMGGIVVSIADSFSSQEMATRIDIAKAKAVFTQDVIRRDGKAHPLYARVTEAKPPTVIVIEKSYEHGLVLRDQDYKWHDFLLDETDFDSISCDPMSPCNILFSSGTTGAPKAIIWNHSTPVKAASDAYFHQNIKNDDVLCWPTNLGWMMGPWIIFAAFMNDATLALYTDIPTNRKFGEFVQVAGVTILGVVPTLVANWKQSACMQGLDWHKIRVFTSTGECSNPEDMRYLMSLAGNKPVIEYCGGTEIGGAYMSSTVIQANFPSQFTSPTMGVDFEILNEQGLPANLGEVAIIPPSIGLSTKLVNSNHHDVYFKDMPKSQHGKKLRRHGDQIQRLDNGNYVVLGRVDDTMNLGGIKVSAAEIERALVGIQDILETAAIAVSPPGNGPSQLVIFAATTTSSMPDKANLMREMQMRINSKINPLFKIKDLVLLKSLPKTASNKIMRRSLRDQYKI